MNKEKKNIRKILERALRENRSTGFNDIMEIDIDAEYDSELSYLENRQYFIEKYTTEEPRFDEYSEAQQEYEQNISKLKTEKAKRLNFEPELMGILDLLNTENQNWLVALIDELKEEFKEIRESNKCLEKELAEALKLICINDDSNYFEDFGSDGSEQMVKIEPIKENSTLKCEPNCKCKECLEWRGFEKERYINV